MNAKLSYVPDAVQAFIYLLCKTYNYLCTCSTFKYWSGSRSRRGLLHFLGCNSCSLSSGDSACLCICVCELFPLYSNDWFKKKKKRGFFFPTAVVYLYLSSSPGFFPKPWREKRAFPRVLSHTCNLRWKLPSLSTDYNVWDPKPFPELSVMTNPFSTLHHLELKNKQCPACLIWLVKFTKGKNFSGWEEIRRN